MPVTQQLSISIPEPERKHPARPYHIDIAVEYDVRAPASRLSSVPEPGASRVFCTLLQYTASVPLAPGAHDGRAAFFACPYRHCLLSCPGG